MPRRSLKLPEGFQAHILHPTPIPISHPQTLVVVVAAEVDPAEVDPAEVDPAEALVEVLVDQTVVLVAQADPAVAQVDLTVAPVQEALAEAPVQEAREEEVDLLPQEALVGAQEVMAPVDPRQEAVEMAVVAVDPAVVEMVVVEVAVEERTPRPSLMEDSKNPPKLVLLLCSLELHLLEPSSPASSSREERQSLRRILSRAP